MKMPDVIETTFFAPCGMNCMVCYKHCDHRKPCAGCLNSDDGKPAHCRSCKIKSCTQGKGLAYCHECGEFPCKRLKTLEKSYNTRYNASLLKNSQTVKEAGLAEFMKRQKEEYTCPVCGGVISIHDAQCSQCGVKKK